MSKTSKLQKKYPPYWNDQRSDSQKLIVNKLAEKLSEKNHERVRPKFTIKNQNQIIFITVGGVPPNQNEFVGLKFPGKTINYRPPCFRNSSTQTSQQFLHSISMENTCQQIHQILIKNNSKKAIFIYHSFGGCIIAWYCHKYSQNIQGLICIGGSPIRFYPIVKDYTKAYLSIPDINRQFIIDNYQVVYSLYDEKTKNHKAWTRFKDKYQLLSFTLHNDPKSLAELFDKIRKLPLPILMVYGDKDQVVTPGFCAEAMVHMSYLHTQRSKYDEKFKIVNERYTQIYGNNQKNLNVQQKLVYFIPGGHSIHVSQKNNKYIQKLIDEYLFLILGGQVQKNQAKL